MDPSWFTPESAPFASMDKGRFFQEMIDLCKDYVPDIERATLRGFLEGPRMVLAGKEDTDARRSVVSVYDDSYFTVFAGKIDHCMWVADEVCDALKDKFSLSESTTV